MVSIGRSAILSTFIVLDDDRAVTRDDQMALAAHAIGAPGIEYSVSANLRRHAKMRNHPT